MERIPQTVRLYGKKLNEWFVEDEEGREKMVQVEYEYKEYDSWTGHLVATGSEDFSNKRSSSDMKHAMVYAWFGEHYLSGRKRYELVKEVTFATRDRRALTEYMKGEYINAKALRIETF